MDVKMSILLIIYYMDIKIKELINEFNKYQELDYSKMICNICNKNNRNNTYNNEFYKCNICKINYVQCVNLNMIIIIK